MSSVTPPNPSARKEYDTPTELFSVINEIRDIRKFFMTRAALLNGEPLWKCTKSELSSQHWMGPWHFNVMQSAICALPGMLISAVAWVFVAEATGRAIDAVDPVQQRIYSILSPMGPPFTLLLVVYAIAYCCLPSGRVSIANWRAAQRKYLYFDAAYGVWPQFIMATCVAILPFAGSQNSLFAVLALLASVVLLGAIVWQAIVTGAKIREELFQYDYLTEQNEMFGMLTGRPFFKFYVVGGLAIPAAVSLLSSGLLGISFLLAGIVHKLRQ